MLILASSDPADHVLPHTFFELPLDLRPFGWESFPLLNFDLGNGKFAFTNHLLMTLVAAGLCLLIFPWMARAYRRTGPEPCVPRGVAGLFEALLQFIRQEVAQPVLKHRTDQFIPFLWTLFFFILFCNLLGMIPLEPIVYLLSGRTVRHVGGTPTGNLAITGGLAICAFFTIHGAGVREVYRGLIAGTFGHHNHDEAGHQDASGSHASHSARRVSSGKAVAIAFPLYMWNFAPHVFKPPADAGAGVKLVLTLLDAIMWLVLLVLELLGAVIKPFALMIRLFANMIAGHIVLASILMLTFTASSVAMGYMVGIISVLGCVAISCLELFVAFLQAYIFVFLTTLFVGMSVSPEH
ncbi:MAG: F0F1 ATP synthase subunit A [Planctomycetes bacterium]|nr:F0F1 ATP synthase subunit A [Planctomycetota bacterium]